MSLTTNSTTQNLFFKSEKKREFSDVLNEVQSYISSKYSALVIDGINNVNSGNDEVKNQVKRYIGKYLLDYRISVEGMSQTQLIDQLYTEMAEFSFLTKYIFGTGIEEININSWDDIEVQYSNGTNVKLDEKFESPDHAINVVRRMLHVSGMVLDNTSPAILGHLSKNIRIAVLKTPLVDEDVGVAASIRIVNSQKLKKEDFLKSGTATDEMMELLSALVRYGVSTTVAGATSSGKTTLTGWLLTTIPHDKRIFTIENGSRELDLVERDKDGKILNKVVHTITRESEDERKSVTQDDLLDMALRFHPDYIVVGEMRSSEADSAQEAARTGHTVLTTTHASSVQGIYPRLATLCMQKHSTPYPTLISFVTEAFPLAVFLKKLDDGKRHIMEIAECLGCDENGKVFTKTLWKYRVDSERIVDGKTVIDGRFVRVNPISKELRERMHENGVPNDVLDRFSEVR